MLHSDDDDDVRAVGGVRKRCLALLMRQRHKNMGFAHTPAVSFHPAHLFYLLSFYHHTSTLGQVEEKSEIVNMFSQVIRRPEGVQMPC